MYCRERVVLDSSTWRRFVTLLKNDSCTVGEAAALEVADVGGLQAGVGDVGAPLFAELAFDAQFSPRQGNPGKFESLNKHSQHSDLSFVCLENLLNRLQIPTGR